MTDSDGGVEINCEENDCELVSEANDFEPQETQFSYINSDFQRDVLLMSEEFENACLEPFVVDGEYEDEFQNHCEYVNTTKYFTTEKAFHVRNELINWAKDVGKEHGVVIVIGKSQNAQVGKAARLWLTCERSGKYRVHKKTIEKNKPKKNTGTKKTDCPFKLRGRSIPNSTRWTVSVENGCHNHPLAKALEGHSYAGRLTQEELDLVKMMTKSGAKPKQCMIMLKQRDPSNLSVTRHVYNAKQKFRMTDMEGRTQMQEILGSLRQKGYLESNRRSENGDVLSQLFWAHPESVQLAKSFPYVFVMDATYKTNMLHWPFLQIVGVTSTGKTFTACQVLMEKEKGLDFTWALERFRDLLGELPSVIVTDRDFALMNAADKIFPDSSKQLCRWHISMAVLRKGKEIFKKDDDKVDKLTNMWRDVVNSNTENDFALNF